MSTDLLLIPVHHSLPEPAERVEHSLVHHSMIISFIQSNFTMRCIRKAGVLLRVPISLAIPFSHFYLLVEHTET